MSARDLDGYAADLERRLEQAANPERRKKTASYFDSSMRLLGVPVPDLRRVAKQAARETAEETPERVLKLAQALIALGSHEARQTAYELLSLRKDVAPLLNATTLESLAEGNDNWASVDAFATTLAGRAWLDGRISDARVRKWAKSEDLWWRRTALATTVCLNFKSRGGTGDPDRTLEICELLAHDDELMVVKALSWALRSVVPHDPNRVQEFLDRHGEALPALVRREVGNKLRSGLKSGKV